jgi:predicted acylesterase/phospholipase RssA
LTFDTERVAARRRPFERLEVHAVRRFLEGGDDEAASMLGALRYCLCFAKLTTVRNPDGSDVDVMGPLAPHAAAMRRLLEPRVTSLGSIWDLSSVMPEAVEQTRRARASLLEHMPIERDALEAEVTTRLLAVASGGGGGAGYVYPGAYALIERAGLVPDLMVGTSIGALVGLFRSRRRRYDFAPLVAAARDLAWTNTFEVLRTEHRYGVPATLRLYLRRAIGRHFLRDDGQAMQMCDLGIPTYTMATGIRVEALKHDLDYYEHLMDETFTGRGIRRGVRGALKAVAVLGEFLSNREALEPVVLGREEGTEDFDALDAAGFSAAIPGVIHYDILRDDKRMHRVLDRLYARRGITRLGEGGIMHNVPARVAWESVADGRFGRRNVFVLALDCFAPNARRIAWLAVQQAVRSANVDADRKFADLYVPFGRTPSPMNLVPSTHDALTAVRWGREEVEPHRPLLKLMMQPLPIL